jgi:hypothetical protein
MSDPHSIPVIRSRTRWVILMLSSLSFVFWWQLFSHAHRILGWIGDHVEMLSAVALLSLSGFVLLASLAGMEIEVRKFEERHGIRGKR